MAKAATPTDPDYLAALTHYRRLVAAVPGLKLKGAANPYTSVNGHMTSYLHPSGSLAMRLPPGRREAFVEAYETSLFEAYGVVQKEYVKVPAELLADTDRLLPDFRAGYDYVAAMKPKPAAKNK
jgi:hypothetical protein